MQPELPSTYDTLNSSLPIRSKNRVVLLDVFRGFAIFGIFMVNIEIMNCMFVHEEEFKSLWNAPIDKLIFRINQLFFYSKFFPIFSFLFGIGLSMQALKIERKKGSKSFFFRRMLILFVIGCAHITFLWSGDVVHLYALLGGGVAYLVKVPNRVLLGLSVGLLIFPFFPDVLNWGMEAFKFQPNAVMQNYAPTDLIHSIREGGYWELVRFRWVEYVSNLPLLLAFFAPIALSMFVLGLWLGKYVGIHNLQALANRITPYAWWILVLVSFYRVIFLVYRHDVLPLLSDGFHFLVFHVMQVSDAITGVLYLWAITKLWKFLWIQKILGELRYVGQMALTNYLLQSAIGLFLFTSVGLGWYNTLSPLQLVIVVLVVFFLQAVLSKLWLSFFLYGPLEWGWRCMSYGKRFDIRRRSR